MIIVLLRHGDAAPSAPTDAERPLTRRGEEEASHAGLLLRKLGFTPTAVLASPLLRAQQTAAIACRHLHAPPVVTTEHLVPSSDHRQIIAELNALAPERVLCVGHEPHLGELIALLIAGTKSVHIVVEKGSLSCLETGRSVRAAGALLRWMAPPDLTKALAG